MRHGTPNSTIAWLRPTTPSWTVRFIATLGSWNKSKIKENVQIGGGTGFDCDDASSDATGLRNCAFTAGKRESGAPTYTYGASGVLTLGPVDLGVTAKKTGKRYIYDTNMSVFSGDVDGLTSDADAIPDPTQIFAKTAPAYWLVNLDARLNMGYFAQDLSKTYLQLNVYNLFDETYLGGFGGGLNQGVSGAGVYGFPPNVQIGAPRTVSLTVNVGF